MYTKSVVLDTNLVDFPSPKAYPSARKLPWSSTSFTFELFAVAEAGKQAKDGNEMKNADSLMNEVTPLAFHLSQNYPNPFREETRIKYCVAYKTRVQLTVLNSAGEVIDTLVDEEKNPGTYEIGFAVNVSPSGEDRNLASGKYSCRLVAGDFSSEKEMELLQ